MDGDAAPTPATPPAAPWWRRLDAKRRFSLALLAAGVTLLVLSGVQTAIRLVSAWDVGVIAFLLLTWQLVAKCPSEQMRKTVLAQDQGRVGILILVITATSASLFAIVFVLRSAKDLAPVPLAAHVAVSVLAIICSWALTHTMFALHYAHRYYRDDPATPEQDATQGLKFPGHEPPDYWDFMYFSFVVGMTSQVSDVQVVSRPMRRLVFWHSVLSFGFYTAILALSINIVAGII